MPAEMKCMLGQGGTIAVAPGPVVLTPVEGTFPPQSGRTLLLFAQEPGKPDADCEITNVDLWEEDKIVAWLPDNPGSNDSDVTFRIELREGSAIQFHTHRVVLITGRERHYPDPPVHLALAELTDGGVTIVPASEGFASEGEVIQVTWPGPTVRAVDFKSWHDEEIQLELPAKTVGADVDLLRFVIASGEGKVFVTLPVGVSVASEFPDE